MFHSKMSVLIVCLDAYKILSTRDENQLLMIQLLMFDSKMAVLIVCLYAYKILSTMKSLME